jgi:hypothetical protein
MPFSTRFSTRTNRIAGSLFASLLLISGAYFFSGPSVFSHQVASAESTDELLKAYATKDTDGDGLPDWEEALYGTDPNKAISNQFGIPDGQAVKEGKLSPKTLKSQLPSDNSSVSPASLPGVDPASGSVTEQFSQEFLQAYTAASSDGHTLSTADEQALISKLLTNIQAKSSKLFESSYTKISLHTSATITNLQYADAVEHIIKKDDLPKEASDPVAIMNELIVNNNESARPKIMAISQAYASLSKDLLATPVPLALTDSHLELIQAFDSLSKITGAVSVYEKDPVGVLSALGAFQPSAGQVQKGFQDIGTILLQGGEPAQGTPGYLIIYLGRLNQNNS